MTMTYLSAHLVRSQELTHFAEGNAQEMLRRQSFITPNARAQLNAARAESRRLAGVFVAFADFYPAANDPIKETA